MLEFMVLNVLILIFFRLKILPIDQQTKQRGHLGIINLFCQFWI